MDLRGESAIITGGASGIGRAILKSLVSAGANVLVVDLDERAAEHAIAPYPANTAFLRADVREVEDVRKIFAACRERFSGSTILVHAAAPPLRSGSILKAPEHIWNDVLAVVLTGGYLLAREFAKTAQATGRGGSIVNIVSTVVDSPRVGSAAYCSAKSGLLALSRVLALELAPLGIRVNAVGPGLTRTPRMEANTSDSYTTAFLKEVPLGRVGESDDIASAVRFLVSPGAAYITGQCLYVDGGYTAGKLSVAAGP